MNISMKRVFKLLNYHKYVRINAEFTRGVRIYPRVVDLAPDHFENIQQKLNDINYYDNPQRLINIGYDNNCEVKARLTALEKEIAKRHDEAVDESESDDHVINNINYNITYRKWLLSETGRKSIIDLANHYAIFRDVFPPPPVPSPQSPIEDIPAKPVFYFDPIVPIHCEFCVNRTELESEETNDIKDNNHSMASPVYRGNLIMPNYCIHPPNVIIDSSAINGIDNVSPDDGSFICKNMQNLFDEKSSAAIKLLGDDTYFYTLTLINLDSHFGDESPVCHWHVSNIHNDNGITKYDNPIDYLPVYGIRGLGYHRYVFVLFRHEKPILNINKINGYDLEQRKFDAYKFVINNAANCKTTPVGLSWFQTQWDYHCQKIFFEKLEMRSPVYEYAFPKRLIRKQQQFPHRAPFNIYLDTYRDPKEMAKEVLLKRLASIHPYQYDDTFKENPIPPNIYPLPKEVPDWYKAAIRKQRLKQGIYRGLRPHSALIPLNNNPDLDKPESPAKPVTQNPINMPLPYPDGKRRPKPLKQTKWVLPPHEHPTLRIEGEHMMSDEDRDKIKLK